MSKKYALYDPKTPEQVQIVDQAEKEMDRLIENFVLQTNKWHEKYVKFGSLDTEAIEAVAISIGRAFHLKSAD